MAVGFGCAVVVVVVERSVRRVRSVGWMSRGGGRSGCGVSEGGGGA